MKKDTNLKRNVGFLPVISLYLAISVTGLAQDRLNIYSVAGANPAAINPEVARFRADLGDLNPNVPQSFPDGRREINWDAVGGTLGNDNLPPDFFHITSPRGLLLATPGTRLKVSGD